MDNDQINLLRRFVDNRCTPEELVQIDALLKTGVPEDIWLILLDEHTLGELPQLVLSPAHKDQLYSLIAERALLLSPPAAYSRRKFVIGIAASFLLMASVFVLFQIRKAKTVTPLAIKTTNKENTLQTIHTSDGSEIWMNSQSSVAYPQEFGSIERTVKLEGEAFFNVVKEPKRPFVVTTEDLRIQVLGTSFDVKSYADEEDVVVTLATGKVQVEGAGEKQFLLPGEQLIFHKRDRTFERKKVTPSDYYSWKDGWMLFNSASLADIARAIERRYAVTVVIDGMIPSDTKVTLKVAPEEDVRNVLDVLSFSTGFHCRVTPGHVLIQH